MTRAKPGTYHSANYPPLADVDPVEAWEHPQGVAFVHDLMAGPLPPAYAVADVLYLEPPWRSGFVEFNTRAGVTDGRTYADFMAAVSRLIPTETRPVVVVTGGHARNMLPPATTEAPIYLNEHSAIAYLYRLDLSDPERLHTSHQLLAELATRYNCVGDPCVGAGASVDAFARVGRTFVASDYNPQCIAHLSQLASHWPGRPNVQP